MIPPTMNLSHRSNEPDSSGVDIQSISANMVRVITNPIVFYQDMAKTGGYSGPVVFSIAKALATPLVMDVLGMVGIELIGMRVMGPGEDFEVAYAPVTAFSGRHALSLNAGFFAVADGHCQHHMDMDALWGRSPMT